MAKHFKTVNTEHRKILKVSMAIMYEKVNYVSIINKVF